MGGLQNRRLYCCLHFKSTLVCYFTPELQIIFSVTEIHCNLDLNKEKKFSCNIIASPGSQDHRRTWTWHLLTLLCFTPISHTVFPTHLGDRGIAEADAGDISCSAGNWTGRPGRPVTPATILTYCQRKEQNSRKQPTCSSNTNSLVKLAF